MIPGPSAPGCTVAHDGTVTFTYRDANARSVQVAGDFTRWGEGAIPLVRDEAGVWTTRATVQPGGYTYKYVVDGAWVTDPDNRLRRADGYGGRNSAFVVGPDFGGPGAIRIASLNLHTYQEPEPLEVLERVALAMVAMDVDVLLLQEVAQHAHDPGRPNAGDVVRDHLAAFTGRPWHHAWFEAHIGFDVYREGESIISSAPLTDVACVPLSEGFLRRIAVLGSTVIKGVSLRLASTHISWERDKAEAEARTLLGALDHAPEAVTVVAGDFNCHAGDTPVRLFVNKGFTDAGAAAGCTEATFLQGPEGRIDFQLVRPRGRTAPRIAAFSRVFDSDPENGYQPLVSDHAGLLGAYSFDGT